MTTADSRNPPSSPVDRVLRQARRMMGLKRLPRAVKAQLTSWTRGRLARGVPEEELDDLVTGRSTIERAEGVLLAEATGDAKVLEQTVPDVRTELDSGEHDDALEAIAHAESAGSDRVGVLRAIDARRDVRDVERLLKGPLASLESALATGAWDERLDELAAAEADGKDRVGAARHIDERRTLKGALQVLDGSVADLRAYLDDTPDAPVDRLLHAERRGKKRKTAIAALTSHHDV